MAEWLREMSVGEWYEAGGEPFENPVAFLQNGADSGVGGDGCFHGRRARFALCLSSMVYSSPPAGAHSSGGSSGRSKGSGR